MIPNRFKNKPNSSTSEVNINMGYENEENISGNMTGEHSEDPLNPNKPPLINIISTGGTSRVQAGHLTPYIARPRKITLSTATTPGQINIDLPSLHQPAQQRRSLSSRSTISNENNNISVCPSSPSVYETPPTQPRKIFLTPHHFHGSSFSNPTSAASSYRTTFDVTPRSDNITIQDRSPSRIFSGFWSRVRNRGGRHAILEINSSLGSSPERSTHQKSFPSNCVIGCSFIITGTIVVIASVICLALIDNTVPDHENGIQFPVYEALYALRGQSRPINSYDLNIEDLNVDVILVHPRDIQDYTETQDISEHGPYTIFDNDHSTYWDPVMQIQSSYFSHSPGYSITVDLQQNYTMTAIRIRDFGNYKHEVTDCQLEVNKDDAWRLVFRHPALPPGHKLKEINGFAVPGSLWKFTVLGTASGKQPWIKEIQFFGIKESYEES